MIGQSEGVGIGKVVRDVVFDQLRVAEVIGRPAVGDEIELIHQTPIDRSDRGIKRVVDVVWNPGHVAEGYDVSGRNPAAGGSFCPGEGAKIIVEGPVLLNDENNVLDVAEPILDVPALHSRFSEPLTRSL